MIGMRRGRREVPYIAQLEALECGAACLAMVLAYHGHHAPLPEVREACGVSRDGVNALAILRAAERYGLEATAYTVSIEQLPAVPLPAILHWNFHHFVVLERLHERGGATLVDPAGGRCTVSAETLASSFTGAILAFSPTPRLQPRRPKQPNLGRYREWIRDNVRSIGLILLCSVLLEMLALAFPIGQQILVDRALGSHDTHLLWRIAAALFAATLVRFALVFARGYVLSNLQAILDVGLLGNFMKHAIRLPIGFFLQRSPGDLLQRLESNGRLRAFLGSEIVTSFLDVLLILGYAGLMFVYHWQLALIVVGIGLLRVLLQILLGGLNRKVSAAELSALSRSGGALVASLDAIETLRAASAESFALRRWGDAVVQRARTSLPRMELENISAQATTLLSALGFATVAAVASAELLAGQMSLGVFSAFLTLQALFLEPVGTLMKNIEQLHHLRSHLARLDDVLDAQPERGGRATAAHLRGEIRLEGVRFRYSAAAEWSVQGVSIHVRAGEMLAIVGSSGSGKSTLARLLLGLLMPGAGSVKFDGRNIGDYDLDELRRRMGAVLQENELLSTTILENIALNDRSVPVANVKKAARLACVDHVIDALPLGYDTQLGERGVQLSGGERQRLCLARAIVHRPAVLVLDEATSALDVDTERRVHRNLRGLACTRVVIAHRLATVRDADRILVMDRGRVVQQGTYESLLGEAGVFRDLVDAGALLHA
ncbi:peptidase domain-containing ABC transporter [Peristeroidobacter agariperforans]|uniref:peptidase domain-containing ABC transporter n=1 Tax=Peristeroidobacter agariperforans TaxID=268404 RepID=UPI0018E54036|nr:ABC transporter transmembrane domain-containing protein [Peristeroidobacter agariperforans]